MAWRLIGAIAAAGIAGVIPAVGLTGIADAAATTAYALGTTPGGPEILPPQAITGIPGTIVQIATSNAADYALTADGTVYSWGDNANGELGNGTTTSTHTSAVQVQFPPGVVIRSLPNPMPYNTALAIDSEGNVWGWGKNEGNELCLRHDTDLKTPTELPLSNVSLATGAGGHAIYDEDGALVGCGANTDGELGDGTISSSASPQPVVDLPSEPVTALTSSWQGSGALLADGSYYDWGFNAEGQLGDGGTDTSDVPVPVPLEAPVVEAFQGGSDAGNGQTLVVLKDGTIWGWGDNRSAQLDTTGTEILSPVRITPPTGVTWTSVGTSGATSYAIDSNGALWAWGKGTEGQLGEAKDKSVPKQVPSLSGVVQVVGTADNAMALEGPG